MTIKVHEIQAFVSESDTSYFQGNQFGDSSRFLEAITVRVEFDEEQIPRRDSTLSGDFRFKLTFGKDFEKSSPRENGIWNQELYDAKVPTVHWRYENKSYGIEQACLTDKMFHHFKNLALDVLPPIPTGDEVLAMIEKEVIRNRAVIAERRQREDEATSRWEHRVNERAELAVADYLP